MLGESIQAALWLRGKAAGLSRVWVVFIGLGVFSLQAREEGEGEGFGLPGARERGPFWSLLLMPWSQL